MAAVTDPSIREAETAGSASERAAAAERAAERAASAAAERKAMQETKATSDEATAGALGIDSLKTMILRKALGLPTMRCDDRFTKNRWR